jgi:hypothetical protein
MLNPLSIRTLYRNTVRTVLDSPFALVAESTVTSLKQYQILSSNLSRTWVLSISIASRFIILCVSHITLANQQVLTSLRARNENHLPNEQVTHNITCLDNFRSQYIVTIYRLSKHSTIRCFISRTAPFEIVATRSCLPYRWCHFVWLPQRFGWMCNSEPYHLGDFETQSLARGSLNRRIKTWGINSLSQSLKREILPRPGYFNKRFPAPHYF